MVKARSTVLRSRKKNTKRQKKHRSVKRFGMSTEYGKTIECSLPSVYPSAQYGLGFGNGPTPVPRTSAGTNYLASDCELSLTKHSTRLTDRSVLETVLAVNGVRTLRPGTTATISTPLPCSVLPSSTS